MPELPASVLALHAKALDTRDLSDVKAAGEAIYAELGRVVEDLPGTDAEADVLLTFAWECAGKIRELEEAAGGLLRPPRSH